MKAQRLSAIRAVRRYKTISGVAALVLAEMPSENFIALERRNAHMTRGGVGSFEAGGVRARHDVEHTFFICQKLRNHRRDVLRILSRALVPKNTLKVLCTFVVCGEGRLSLIESAPLRRLLIGEALKLRKCRVAMVEGILKEKEEGERRR